LGNNELRRKETVEVNWRKSSSKSQDSSSKSYVEKMKEYIGPAYAGVWKAAEATMKGATAVFAVQSGFGIGRVEGFSAPSSGTELQVRGDSNLSKVPEYFVQQKRISQAEKQMQLLQDVAARAKENPEFARKLLEHFGKSMKNPEKFFQTLEQQEQKRAQRQDQRQQLAKNTQEALEDLRTLFQEMPEKVKNRKIDIGTERLTPEKINPEVWDNVRRMLTERRELNDNTGTTVVLVHGFVGNGGDPVNCGGGYWGDAINYLKTQGYSDCRTVKFYNSDVNCDVDLHNSIYAGPCSQYAQGSEGTNNESLDHVSCLLAQYLYQNFGKSNQNVILVGHSMGGIIIRNTMYLTQVNNESPVIPTPFPPSIGTVTDAVTFNSPHGGVPSVGGLADLVACGNCKQVAELTSGSDFMNSLGLYPQVPGGATRWTIVGSECDLLVSPVSAISMNADQAVVYSTRGKSDNTCYDHGGALHDGNVINNAIQYTCSTDNPVNSPCGTAYASTNGAWTVGQGPRGLQELYHAASS
jgi:hypothetical protein